VQNGIGSPWSRLWGAKYRETEQVEILDIEILDIIKDLKVLTRKLYR